MKPCPQNDFPSHGNRTARRRSANRHGVGVRTGRFANPPDECSADRHDRHASANEDTATDGRLHIHQNRNGHPDATTNRNAHGLSRPDTAREHDTHCIDGSVEVTHAKCHANPRNHPNPHTDE